MNVNITENNSTEIKIAVLGRIDSDTELKLEEFVFSIDAFDEKKTVILDFEQVEYISSAGLRLMLKIMKAKKELQIINVSHDVYDVFEMTGFTELCTVQKQYRQVDVTGCTTIGAGANGIIYRLDAERILKLYTRPNVLNSIIREKANAKYAFLLGIPTAISFDIVKVGDKFGSVFELLEASSIANLVIKDPESLDSYIKPYTKLIKDLHAIPYVERDNVNLPAFTDRIRKYIDLIKEHYSDELHEALVHFLDDIPECNTMLHGDCHPFNVMVTKEEMVFIDMDTLSVGHPVLELGSMYNAYIGFRALDHGSAKEFLGFEYETGVEFWNETLRLYYQTNDNAVLAMREKQAATVGLVRLLRRSIRRNEDPAFAEYCRNQLCTLVSELDTLI